MGAPKQAEPAALARTDTRRPHPALSVRPATPPDLGALTEPDAQAGATSRVLVAIDRDGAVVSPLRRYAGRAAAYGALSLLGTIGAASLASGDPLVLALSLVGTAAWGHGILVTRWLERASALTLRGELDEAELLLRRCLRPPWGSESVRAHAHLRLASVATRRGQHAEAQREAQQAVELFLSEYPPQPQFVQLGRYQEIRALVSLGRQPDARYLLEELGPIPSGEFLRVQHYLTELYVAHGDGRAALLGGPLWERAQAALRTPSSSPLLALCAWGFSKLGETEVCRRLLHVAYERADEPIAETMPLLWRWMEEQGPV